MNRGDVAIWKLALWVEETEVGELQRPHLVTDPLLSTPGRGPQRVLMLAVENEFASLVVNCGVGIRQCAAWSAEHVADL
jgi:hypothetical protein